MRALHVTSLLATLIDQFVYFILFSIIADDVVGVENNVIVGWVMTNKRMC